jgi:biotin transport system substrate-specific component
MQAPTQATLFAITRPDNQVLQALWLAAAVALGVCLLTLSAKVQVPFWPVPMTMQTLVVLMLGMAYGPWLGAGTALAYLAVGAMGFPVFAGTPERGIGLPYMLGPTGGFLLGFVAAAWLAGVLAARGWDRTILRCGVANLLGTAVIIAAGIAWLVPAVGLVRAIEVGFVPFLASSVVKIALGAVSLPMIWRLVAAQK